jgi:hypothetical protein
MSRTELAALLALMLATVVGLVALPIEHQKNPVPPAWDDFVVPVTAVKAGAAIREPGFEKVGGGAQGVYSYQFDGAAEEEVFFSVQTPHAWDRQNMDLHLHVAPGDDRGGTAVFGVEWISNGIGSQLASAGTIATAALVIASDTHLMHRLCQLSTTNMIPTPTDSSVLLARVYRDVTATADDYPGDVVLLSIDCHFRRTKLGSTARTGD